MTESLRFRTALDLYRERARGASQEEVDAAIEAVEQEVGRHD
jgi:hypothetical protein